MLICDENNQSIFLDDLNQPIPFSYIWGLDLNILEFKLNKLTILEEFISSSIEVWLDGYSLVLPCHWYILIADQDTLKIDCVQLSEIVGNRFSALVVGAIGNRYSILPLVVTNYYSEIKHIVPNISKTQMMCHSIGENEMITIGPYNAFKYVKDLEISDII